VISMQDAAARTSTDTKDATGTYDYVIVGAGVAGASAARAIRRHDEEGTTLVLGREDDGPFYRPDLSKTLWLEDDAAPGASPPPAGCWTTRRGQSCGPE
jgi:choline dehydrogenase-like flavoprotein